MKAGWRQCLALAVGPRLYLALTRALFATVRETTPGAGHYQRLLASGQPFIACMWHYSLLYGMSRAEGRGWVVMASASEDAEYIARALHLMGQVTVRGSRTKGGLAALRELRAQMRDHGRRAAIVGDGSQGPALELQAGVVLLASKTGAPILPLAWGADRYWAFRSWDRTALPKPFARVNMCFGEPISVPAGLTAQGLEEHRREIEAALIELYRQAWRPFGVVDHARSGIANGNRGQVK